MSDSDNFPFGQKSVWEPNPQWIAESNIQALMNRLGLASYEDLYRWSIADVGRFWETVLRDLDIRFYQPYREIVNLDEGMALPRWCVGAKMNIVHNCLDKWQETATRDKVALSWEGEEGRIQTFTYGELFAEVNRCANALRRLGIGKGDAVALFMPMIPEIIIAFLAIAKVGGIILPLFSGYGAGAVATRVQDGAARLVVTANGMLRRGTIRGMKPTLDEALQECPTVENVLVVDRTGDREIPWLDGRDLWWDELVSPQSSEAETEKTDAEDPVMIIYTSGTTGQPKGLVHTHCGFPVKAAQDMFHPMDVKPEDTLYWMSDMGWMMGPWMVFGTTLLGASMALYDGAPDYPGPDRLWEVVDRHRISHLGISPTLIRALKTHGTAPVEGHHLDSLRMVGSTGSPWDPESWMWLFENVLKREKPILNYSGGSEISGGIVCGHFFYPLKPGAFSGPVLGMDADVVDETGEPVREAVGELILRKPWIGMTRAFLNNRERYLATYWQRFPDIWVHGDFAAIDKDGLWYILGRSDDTIKVAGKRLGPTEVESVANAHPRVVESAAIAVPHPVKGSEVVVFCVCRSRADESEPLRGELVDLLVKELGKPLKPRAVYFTTALPKTRNAKVMRRLIRAVHLEEPLGDTSSLEDPATLEEIRQAR